MKAILNTAKGELKLSELPKPSPGAGEVRIRTSVCGICASDLEMIDGWPRGKYPQVLGHEWAGIVDECGTGADKSLLDKYCVAENVLKDGGEVGFEHPGGYAQYFITQADKLIVLPKGFDMEIAALIEPLAVAVRGMKRMNPSKDPALIIGDGPIGLLMLMLMKRHGMKDVTLVGGRETRLKLALELGAARTLNYHEAGKSLPDYVAKQGLKPFSSIVEAAKSADAIPLASKLGANGAKILLIGNYVEVRSEVILQEFLHKEFELLGSNASAGAWEEAVRIAAEGKLPLRKIVSGVYKAEDFEKAMDTARNNRSSMKILLKWE
ncbi:MAG TPA: hypothetical protein DCZ94_08770 [Lentisphaeria bacterium]|nr:MAG: hypothetical protein A2X48_23630 [Lentisphaerae bacterium GWF2_49_21]HBC87032.1 hypothetical protein [Lentisphaeria bacterium]